MTICLENEKKGCTAVRSYLVKSKNGGKFVLQLIYPSDEEKKNIPKKNIKTVSLACQDRLGDFSL